MRAGDMFGWKFGSDRWGRMGAVVVVGCVKQYAVVRRPRCAPFVVPIRDLMKCERITRNGLTVTEAAGRYDSLERSPR